MRVSVRDKTTGAIVARKRGVSDACARWAEQFAPEQFEVLEAWLPITKQEAPQDLRKVRVERNRLLTRWDWTVGAASPLSAANQREWKQYLLALHRVTKDLVDPADVVWPTQPELVYDDAA